MTERDQAQPLTKDRKSSNVRDRPRDPDPRRRPPGMRSDADPDNPQIYRGLD